MMSVRAFHHSRLFCPFEAASLLWRGVLLLCLLCLLLLPMGKLTVDARILGERVMEEERPPRGLLLCVLLTRRTRRRR